MHIEKIRNADSDLFSPGLVDLFYDTKMQEDPNMYFGNMFPKLCVEFGDSIKSKFTLGSVWGREGALIHEAMASNDDIYFEICARNLRLLPKHLIRHFLKNHNVIVHDYIEGPQWLTADIFDDGTNGNPIEYIKQLNVIPKNVIIATCGGENYDNKHLNITTGFVPLWLMLVFSERPKNLKFTFEPKRLALIAARKARNDRVKLLAKLYQDNLLKDCDWSLLLNFHEDGKVGDFFTSPSLSSKRWHLLQSSDEPYIQRFYADHKDILPKIFEQLPSNTFKDNHAYDINWAGYYDYTISCETLTNEKGIFPTEKTFKSMMLGIPMLTLACKGFDEWLQSKGFKTLGNFDHTWGQERAFSIVKHLHNHSADDREQNKIVAEHNFNLVHNKQFILDLIDLKKAPTRQ